MTSEPRREYNTGAVRSASCEKIRYDLISPIGLRRLAETYAEGAEKFGAFNWENGMPVTDLLNHAIAHIYAFLSGSRDEDDLGHAAWNILAAIHSMEKWPHLNDQWLRGPNCECPSAARNAAQQKETGPENKHNSCTSDAVPCPPADRRATDDDIAELRNIIFGKRN